jgi:hypothetical protein
MKTDEARVVLADLESKAAATRTAIAEINEKRAELAFAAHGAANPNAQKALAKCNADRTAKLDELEELEHAIGEARRLCAILASATPVGGVILPLPAGLGRLQLDCSRTWSIR